MRLVKYACFSHALALPPIFRCSSAQPLVQKWPTATLGSISANPACYEGILAVITEQRVG